MPHLCQKSMRKGKYIKKTDREKEFSKKLITDTRRLLWIVTIGGLTLAVWCVHAGFDASLPWLSAMVGLPWTAHGAICSFYLNMAKSDHREGGITFETAKANGFEKTDEVDMGGDGSVG